MASAPPPPLSVSSLLVPLIDTCVFLFCSINAAPVHENASHPRRTGCRRPRQQLPSSHWAVGMAAVAVQAGHVAVTDGDQGCSRDVVRSKKLLIVIPKADLNPAVEQ